MPEFKLVQEDARLFSLQITEVAVDDGPDHLTLWMSDHDAIQLFEAVEKGIGDHVAQMREAKREFEAATGYERGDDDDAYPPDDPKSAGFYERAVEAYDLRDKP